MRLHAQLSQITAIVRLCNSIAQLQLSQYTCWWENRIIRPEHVIVRYARWRCTHFCTLVVTETPPADLFMSPAASAFKKYGVRRARRSYIFTHFVYGVHDNYTNQVHNDALSCGDFGGKTPPPPSVYFRLTAPGKKSCACTERKIRSAPLERIHAGVMRLSIE